MAESATENTPYKKRKLTFTENTCCFCQKKIKQNKVTLKPSKLDSLLSVCLTKNDEISTNILGNQDKIRNGELQIVYHKTCRTKFVHPFYNSKTEEDDNPRSTPSKLTRSQSKPKEFDWKEMCFICGEKCSSKHRNKWSKVEGSIDENSKLYSKLLKVSAEKGDQILHSRLLSSNGDLVAVEARYHRKKHCLATYLLYDDTNVQSESELDMICKSLKSEITDEVENRKRVYDLSQIRSQVQELGKLKNLKIEKLTNKQTKRALKRVWPTLRFIHRTGLSDLVCSNTLSIDDALCNFVRLEKQLETVEEQNDLDLSLAENFERSESHELSVIREAAMVIRNRLLNAKTITNEYFSSQEITAEAQKQFLDKHLLLFVKWLSVDTDETNTDEIAFTQQELSVCSDIAYLVKPTTTPKHLGLSVYLHHSYGSKKLIEDLHAHGYTWSYTEVRHFLTSAALHMSSAQDQTPSGGVVPSQLTHTSTESGGDLIVGVADNWDHNENTLSGKRSTHAMTSILTQTASGQAHTLPSRIPRVPERSIDVSSLPGRGLAHTLVYRKPDRRPSPALQPPVQPDELCFTEPDDAKVLRMKELLYTVGRNVLLDMCDDRAVSDTSFPPWTVFQGLVQNDVTSDAVNVAFNPIIMAPPNDFSTVYTVLKRTKEQMNALGQTICPIVFDMGLLSKALEIVWANPREFEGVYPLEGGMHFLMSVFGGIGHLYGDAGLLQLLVESDVFARLTAEHILSGKDYDRALRGLIMVDEVMNRRFFVQFFKWAEANSVAIPPAIFDKIKQLGADVVKRDTDISVLLQDMQTEILPLIESFREEGRTSSPLFRFWDDYLSEVSWPMKLFLAASRHGMWQAQQYAKAKLLPFLFSSNRTVYSRFMPYLVLQHTRLPTELLEQFEEGRFVAKLTEGCFNSVWFDYILEVTENKALKSSGGIIGLTHNDSALTRWFLARPVTAKYAMAYMTHKSSKSLTHHTNTPFHSQAYNTAVQKMLSLFESDTFIDPFSLSFPPSRLVNIASGVEMPSDVETSLLNCHTSGKQSLINFVSERLVPKEGNLPTKEFFDPMPKTKILTTRSIRSKGKPKSGLSPINGEDMYLRLLAINSLKKVPLDRVLSFENAPVPLSLFTDDGSFMSCKKSDFLEKLESLLDSNSYSMTASSPVDCYVYDAMAVVQMIQPQSGVKTTYQMMAASFWKYILAHRQGAKQVHVLFDRYIPDSLKNQTRLVRGETLSSGPVAIQSNMLIGDWKRVMSSTKSKSELTRLYTRFLTENCHELLDDNTVVYVAGGLGAKTLRVTSTYVEYVDSLSSNHEEADTRILLHIAYAGTLDVQQVVVFSPDTDVFVLLVHHFPQLKVGTLYFKTGRKGLHRDMTRYIPVHEVVGSMNRQQKQIMLAVYCITGCDTCSSLHGIGKKKAFQVMSKNADELENLTNLGTEPTISAETKAAAIKLVGLLYGHTNCTSLNALRSVLALRKRPVKPRKMPPTNNSFSLHLLRCIHQLLIWRSALSAMMTSYDPIDFGYSKDLETGIYHPQLMTQAAAPPELLSDLVCTCSDLCADDCVCSHNEQPCTHACRCEGQLKDQVCENLFTMLAHVQTSEFELEDLM